MPPPPPNTPPPPGPASTSRRALVAAVAPADPHQHTDQGSTPPHPPPTRTPARRRRRSTTRSRRQPPGRNAQPPRLPPPVRRRQPGYFVRRACTAHRGGVDGSTNGFLESTGAGSYGGVPAPATWAARSPPPCDAGGGRHLRARAPGEDARLSASSRSSTPATRTTWKETSLDKCIGQGSFGSVYRGTGPAADGRGEAGLVR